jgi:hypothetical protein
MGVAHDDASKRTAEQVDNRKIGAVALSRWHSDPISFSREVLRTRLWARQADILLAARDHRRVAIRSGHECGKTTALACLALWWVCTRPRARVIMTAASHRQVASVLWREVRRLHRGARVPIGGDMHESPESGLQFKSGAEIIGFSTKEPERMAGFSGPDMLFLVDDHGDTHVLDDVPVEAPAWVVEAWRGADAAQLRGGMSLLHAHGMKARIDRRRAFGALVWVFGEIAAYLARVRVSSLPAAPTKPSRRRAGGSPS